MIDLGNITFSYPNARVPALSGVDASIGEGIYLLLGENGAGKTTLLHLMATLLFPTEGSVTINGDDSRRRLPSTLRSLYFLPDDARMPADTVEQLVKLHGSVFYPRFDAAMLADNLRAFGIDARIPFDMMSLGQRKKAYIAYALALRTDILLLDEPANGLDIGSRDLLRNLMARCVEPGQTVVISTHQTADLQPLYDGIIMLRRGKMLFSLSTAEITNRIGFGVFDIPPRSALYTMSDIGRFRSIIPADPDSPSEIDIHLLYSALQCREGEGVLSVLANPQNPSQS
ncbi:MAG: ABC transporter ATP-binding protein [Candidatus Amulumruptor sp.]|nr:ABC transporter ATP-binding protein [Candidatus Amulumruptor sp.]MDE7237207.1 ABC transporter ATP-binding protein [Paramuribaculum sp.]